MDKQDFFRLAQRHPVAAAIKNEEEGERALAAQTRLLFILKGDAFGLTHLVAQAHNHHKGIIVHLDLIGGLGKDRSGIHYLHQIGVDGIITSRAQLITAARAEGMITIQRLLLLDQAALEAGAKSIARVKPDFVEVLPGVIFPEVVARLRPLLPGPFIAGGFIRTHADVDAARAAGAILCSSSTPELWD
jgi:glycerol uptake operon antiterminator